MTEAIQGPVVQSTINLAQAFSCTRVYFARRFFSALHKLNAWNRLPKRKGKNIDNSPDSLKMAILVQTEKLTSVFNLGGLQNGKILFVCLFVCGSFLSLNTP